MPARQNLVVESMNSFAGRPIFTAMPTRTSQASDWANVDLLPIAQQFETPLYVYHADIIERQYKRLVNAFDVPKLELHYACKANTNLEVLRFMRSLGAGLDCVSLNEVRIGLKAGFAEEDILYTPNGVSLAEMLEAIDLGVGINVDSTSILEQLGQARPDVPVCIRINPHIMAGGNQKISTGHIDSKFGISIHQLPHVLRIVETTGITVSGVHMHTGSDIYDVAPFLAAADILLRVARQFPDLEYVDFGSGFKVPYKEGDIATDIEEMGELMSTRFREFCKDYGREVALVFEPGKFLVSEAGRFLVEANVVKTTPSTVFVGVNSGLNHLIRPMFYDSYHHIENVSNPKGKSRIYTVVGYICETDTFGANRQLAEVREGDVLGMHNAGAYCNTMASNYNSRERPAEVLIVDGEAHLVRRRETLEDLLGTQVEIGEMVKS